MTNSGPCIKPLKEYKNLNISISEKEGFGGAHIINVRAEASAEPEDGSFTVVLTSANRDTYSVWAPLHVKDRPVYPTWRQMFRVESRANNGFPLMQFLDKAGNNICTAALSDVYSQTSMLGGIFEKTGNLEVKITLPAPESGTYETDVFVYTERVPFYRAVGVYNAYKETAGLAPAFVPDCAREALYSTWYAFQRNVTARNVLDECLKAKEYGLKTVIIDDGWQLPPGYDPDRPYLTIGDWDCYEEQFGDMKALCDTLHENGIKVMLWIATPYVGTESRAFRLLDGRFFGRERDGTVVTADPRYRAVRDYYVSLLPELMKKWKLDGFKLDFIDNFTYAEDFECSDVRDIPDTGTAVTVMLDDISAALRKINPDVMLEYRQSYIGPAMQKSGNMFRVDDCAYGAMYNRINGMDLRLAADKSAVHSDMLMWDYNASDEAAADQLSALLFIVPQISVLFDRLSPSHAKMLRFYLDFIAENRDVLQYGELCALYPEADYSVIFAKNGEKLIAALYSANSFTVPRGTGDFRLVNASGVTGVFLGFEDVPAGCEYIIRNCLGDVVSTGEISGSAGFYPVPPNGIFEASLK